MTSERCLPDVCGQQMLSRSRDLNRHLADVCVLSEHTKPIAELLSET